MNILAVVNDYDDYLVKVETGFEGEWYEIESLDDLVEYVAREYELEYDGDVLKGAITNRDNDLLEEIGYDDFEKLQNRLLWLSDTSLADKISIADTITSYVQEVSDDTVWTAGYWTGYQAALAEKKEN